MAHEWVLIVEDDDGLRSLLNDELQDAGLETHTAPSAEEAKAVLKQRRPALVISDIRLPGADGMALLREVQQQERAPAFIIITAFGSISQAVEALKAGADDFLTKPLDLEHLRLSVRRTLENQRLRQRVEALDAAVGEAPFHGMVGRSKAMRQLFDTIARVARASGPVLIEGESGTGKELVAQAVHKESPRADGPFLAVNCAGVPADLLESEFFGHAKGAFTGAQQARDGLFVEASGGTLLLDEIGEMPVALQAKLLRVLQEGTVRPVGSNRPVAVDVRILASTNRTLREEVTADNFREDLFYRLETFRLKVPPLRQRGDDVERLAAYFLQHYRHEMGRGELRLAPETLRTLKQYAFPGNVRELQNAMERAVAFSEDHTIAPQHLPERIQQQTTVPDPSGGANGGIADAIPLPDDPEALLPLRAIEQRYIRHVLNAVDGNKKRAATLLGIGRRTLYRRLEEADANV